MIMLHFAGSSPHAVLMLAVYVIKLQMRALLIKRCAVITPVGNKSVRLLSARSLSHLRRQPLCSSLLLTSLYFFRLLVSLPRKAKNERKHKSNYCAKACPNYIAFPPQMSLGSLGAGARLHDHISGLEKNGCRTEMISRGNHLTRSRHRASLKSVDSRSPVSSPQPAGQPLFGGLRLDHISSPLARHRREYYYIGHQGH